MLRAWIDWRRRPTLWIVAVLALIYTLANLVKPLHIDDPFVYLVAEQIRQAPTNPYGFDILWYQWPQPVHEELTPPVLPYWWALGISLFGQYEWAWKLWLFPFALLFALALGSLFQRFARGLALPMIALTLFSPAFLPSFNLMQDIPALALGLSGVIVYLRAARNHSLALALTAGLVAGLATQTKYTMVTMLAVIGLHGLLWGRLRLALPAIGVALAVFFGWEALMTWRYGQGMFFGQVQFGLFWTPRLAMIGPLLRLLGGTLGVLSILGLAALGAGRAVTAGLLALLVAAYAALWVAPIHATLYLTTGLLTAGVVIACAARLCTRGLTASPRPSLMRGWRRWRTEWLLVGWLVAEVVVFFAAAPFPAVRRVMGIVIVSSLLIARLAAPAVRRSTRRLGLPEIAAVQVVLALLIAVVDVAEARAQASAPGAALAHIRRLDPAPGQIWFTGHWGFKHYAEALGMKPVIPDHSRLAAGDWVIVPDRVDQQAVAFLQTDISTEAVLHQPSRLPLWTSYGFYGGSLPLEHARGPRLSTLIYRIRRDTTPESAWSIGQLAEWAHEAGGQQGRWAGAGLLRELRRQLDPRARRLAAEALGVLFAGGWESEEARAALHQVAETDADPGVREAAANAAQRGKAPSRGRTPSRRRRPTQRSRSVGVMKRSG